MAAELDRSPTTIRYWLGRYGLATERARRRDASGALVVEVVRVCRSHGETRFVREGRGYYRCARCRRERVADWRRRARSTLVAEAGGSCALCGYSRCIGTLEFHHVVPGRKRFGLSYRGLTRSLEELRKEAAKCVLLCSNCHVEVEAGVAALPSSLDREHDR